MTHRPTRLRVPEKVKFDANNQVHRQAYLTFLDTKKWPIQFDIEWPFTSIPAMVMFHLAAKACEKDGNIDIQAILEVASTESTVEGAVAVKPEAQPA